MRNTWKNRKKSSLPVATAGSKHGPGPSSKHGPGPGSKGRSSNKAVLNRFVKVAVRVSKTRIALKGEDSDGGDKSSSDEDHSEEEGIVDLRTLLSQEELPQEFWQIQKLTRYLKIGNQTATVLALCVLNDFDLEKSYCQLAIYDAGGLEVLANLLDTDDAKCKFGSLRILRRITNHPAVRRRTTFMGGIEVLIKILTDPDMELQLLAAETMANLAKFRKARMIIRRTGGIPKLIDLLDVDVAKMNQEFEGGNPDLPLALRVARGSAYALWGLSKSRRNKQAIKKRGGLPLLAKLVKLKQSSVLIAVIGTLQECSSERSYCLAMQSEGIVEDLVRYLSTSNQELKMLSANAIFHLAEEEETRHLVKLHGGLEPLVDLIKDRPNQGKKELMAAVSGAIWKCSFSLENVLRFQDLDLISILIKILRENCDALDDLQFNPKKIGILTNVVGAIAEGAKTKHNINKIVDDGGLAPLIKLMATNHPDLLVNVSKALGRIAEEKKLLRTIHKLDGVRLIWSLLKNPCEKVQASAAWALSPCIKNAQNSGDMVRSFVGGLELICGLLRSSDIQVLAAVCYAIANIAKDKENLAVITDHGVIEKLSKLADTDDDLLRAKLAEAIGNCCDWSGNRALFGRSGAVAPLVSYLTTQDLEVHRSASVALYQLSKDPWNCVTMHANGVVPHLLRLIGSHDELVQEASADCLQNIRKLALACEKFRYQHVNAKA